MNNAIAKFRQRKPSDIQPNPKADNDESSKSPKKLPDWAKWIIGCNILMVHLVIVLVGVEDISFTLNDITLTAYVVTGLGVPIGLANRTVVNALAGAFGIKS